MEPPRLSWLLHKTQKSYRQSVSVKSSYFLNVMAIYQGRAAKWYHLDLLCLADASRAKGMSTAHTYIVGEI